MSQSMLASFAAGFWYGGKLVGAGEMSFTDMMQVRSWVPQWPIGMQELAFFMHGLGPVGHCVAACRSGARAPQAWCTSGMVSHLWTSHKHGR